MGNCDTGAGGEVGEEGEREEERKEGGGEDERKIE
jgi:hypothetical protein